jgi:archaemetzincin
LPIVERAAAPVAIVPLGKVARATLRMFEQILEEVFAAPSVVLPSVALAEDALAEARGQYDADVLLDELFARLPERCLRVIGVTEADLYIHGRTFVFGYAHLSDGMAICSVERLRESYYGRADDPARFSARLRRAAVHELGHTFGVPHCERRECVMHPVTFVETLDALPERYCGTCLAPVVEGLAIEPWSARGRRARGLAHFRRRDFRRAAHELSHAARCSPLDATLQHELCAAWAGAGELERARQALVRAIELWPESEACEML